jgi:hypothetical protein
MSWHHIVERWQVPRFGAEAIHNIANVVATPNDVHKELSRLYSSIRPYSRPFIVRRWLAPMSFEEQHQFGMEQLREFSGYPLAKE